MATADITFDEEWLRSIIRSVVAEEAAECDRTLMDRNADLELAMTAVADRLIAWPHLAIDGDCWYSCPLATERSGESAYCGPIERDDRHCECAAEHLHELGHKLKAVLK